MDEAKKLTVAKAVFLICTWGYFMYCALDRLGYHFFDTVDLVIHEAGHPLFGLFGEFAGVTGGTILQLLVPLVFVAYFFKRKDLYSAGIVSLWLGQSFINVARYAGDAILMELPLLGGGTHDWNYLLSTTGLLGETALISGFFYYAGMAILTAAAIIGLSSFFGQNSSSVALSEKNI